jgi:hypothetical protein
MVLIRKNIGIINKKRADSFKVGSGVKKNVDQILSGCGIAMQHR